jgi:hypothetical protein
VEKKYTSLLWGIKNFMESTEKHAVEQKMTYLKKNYENQSSAELWQMEMEMNFFFRNDGDELAPRGEEEMG